MKKQTDRLSDCSRGSAPLTCISEEWSGSSGGVDIECVSKSIVDYNDPQPSSSYDNDRSHHYRHRHHRHHHHHRPPPPPPPSPFHFEAIMKGVVAPALALVLLPLSFYADGERLLPYEKRANAIRDVIVGWESLLHMSVWPVISITAAVAFIVAHCCNRSIGGENGGGGVVGDKARPPSSNYECRPTNATASSSSSSTSMLTTPSSSSLSWWRAKRSAVVSIVAKRWPLGRIGTAVLCTALFFSLGATVQSQVQVISPSALWNPLLWGRYTVYMPDDISSALENVCVDNYIKGGVAVGAGRGSAISGDGVDGASTTMAAATAAALKTNRMRSASASSALSSPLCLSESAWDELSSGFLSSQNPKDVETVLSGLAMSRGDSFGLAIAVLARDTAGSIGAFRKNVEGIAPFVTRLSVVVFENDSSDGTRDAFRRWAAEVNGVASYTVDLMECEEVADCRFGLMHRYDGEATKDFFVSSAVGKMADFRQRIVDYVRESDAYRAYSHILVMDVDLGISLSPLGLLHALGSKPDAAVASSARQPWPGSFGSLTPQYDFSAFRSIETPRNRRILWLHRKFCELAPPGDRWRNICDCISPMMFMLVWGHDRGSGGELFPVASAFNGAVLYPLDLIRETGAKYDAGDDGQRCEHIGFNLSLRKPTFVDPKWMMNLKPSKIGGPDGSHALMNIMRIVFSPKISLPIFLQNFGCMVLFVYCIIVLTINLLYPLWRKVLGGTRFKDAALFMDPRGSAHKNGSELDLFIRRKRKVSSCEQIAKTV